LKAKVRSHPVNAKRLTECPGTSDPCESAAEAGAVQTLRVVGCIQSERLHFQNPGRIQALPPNATRLERGCVQSTSRSTLKNSAAPGVFQQAGFAKLLRLVFDTTALRG
jgi:hypothetical protein